MFFGCLELVLQPTVNRQNHQPRHYIVCKAQDLWAFSGYHTLAKGVVMGMLAMHRFITALSRNVIALMRHVLKRVLRVTHRLHPRGLDLSMLAMRIWQCMESLLHTLVKHAPLKSAALVVRPKNIQMPH
jgi:hypothetical protein